MKTDSSGLSTQLALQMVEYMRRSNLEAGAHLVEQQLANVLNVSRSPVRRALAVLEKMGVVAQQRHRGYFLNKIPAKLDATGLPEAAASAEERYLQVADDRLAGHLEDHITETALMRRYHMPRRELQRILHRMEKEGWIERKPGHGWMFLALADSVEAHAQSYRFRMLFEPAALLEPGFRIVKPELERVRRDQQMLLDGGVNKVSRSKLFEIGSDFHETLMRFSGNRFMQDAIKRVNAMRRLLEYRAHYDRERITGQCREHLHLLDLLEQGAQEEAAHYLRKHLEVVRAIKTERGTRIKPASNVVSAQL
jgi:DNA-binding GntR family transcriptional regulator